MPDFVLSRVATVPASRKDKFPAFTLRGGGDASSKIEVTLSEVEFFSDAGYRTAPDNDISWSTQLD